ncbi:hypothetical protein NEIFLAOT_02116 [Neisseria flavescens NRL30031/H210]|uniref:Uncharacterized protein n=1 Tax=Neisseria flavescens NRL30031/H210 TaxID=546264 RepID=C0EQ74_NEIFL|nr:hypothetical protein NEIFLAOT_02116 [Neisseria flavescens NRL30031/H210]
MSVEKRPSETQNIGVSDGLFSGNLFGMILGSLGIIIAGLGSETAPWQWGCFI